MYSLMDNPNTDRTGQFNLQYDNPELAQFLQQDPQDASGQADEHASMSKFLKGLSTMQGAAQKSKLLQQMLGDHMTASRPGMAPQDVSGAYHGPAGDQVSDGQDMSDFITQLLLHSLGL